MNMNIAIFFFYEKGQKASSQNLFPEMLLNYLSLIFIFLPDTDFSFWHLGLSSCSGSRKIRKKNCALFRNFSFNVECVCCWNSGNWELRNPHDQLLTCFKSFTMSSCEYYFTAKDFASRVVKLKLFTSKIKKDLYRLKLTMREALGPRNKKVEEDDVRLLCNFASCSKRPNPIQQ